MHYPTQGTSPRLPGGSPAISINAGKQPISTMQRTVLERLITRIIALSQQQNIEVWAGLKHDLGLKNEAPLLACHFPAAEQNLNQRLATAQTTFTTRQLLQQLSVLLSQGNNHQAVRDYIRQQFGQTALSQLTEQQLKNVLRLLQDNQLPTPQPPQRPTTDRPLLPAEHSTLNQQVMKLAAMTGESGKQIWQSILELASVKDGDPIPAKYFAQLTTWLQARQTLSQRSAPTLRTIQGALKQPLNPTEWQAIVDYCQLRFQAASQTVLSAAQVQDVLNQVFLTRAGRHHHRTETENIQPIFNPLFAPFIEPVKTWCTKPGRVLLAIVMTIILLWIVI